jgi:hypothetical protein
MQKTADQRKATKKAYNDVYQSKLKESVKMKAAQSKSAEAAKKEEQEHCVETLRGLLVKLLIRKYPLTNGKMINPLIDAVASSYIDFHTKYDDGKEDLSAARDKGDVLKHNLGRFCDVLKRI